MCQVASSASSHNQNFSLSRDLFQSSDLQIIRTNSDLNLFSSSSRLEVQMSANRLETKLA